MRKRTHWSPLMDEYLMKKRAQGETFKEIAMVLGVTRAGATLRYRVVCAENRIPRYKWSPAKHSHELRERVVSLKLSGKKLTEVAAIVGVQVNQATGIWNRWRDAQQQERHAA